MSHLVEVRSIGAEGPVPARGATFAELPARGDYVWIDQRRWEVLQRELFNEEDLRDSVSVARITVVHRPGGYLP